jgi:hypothetical protein
VPGCHGNAYEKMQQMDEDWDMDNTAADAKKTGNMADHAT